MQFLPDLVARDAKRRQAEADRLPTESEVDAFLRQKEQDEVDAYLRQKLGTSAYFIHKAVTGTEDNARRLASETGATGWDAVEGMSSLPRAALGTFIEGVGKFATKTGDLTELEAARRVLEMKAEADQHPLLQGLAASAQNARAISEQARGPSYAIDRSRDADLSAQLAGGLGSLPAAIATGPAAPVVVAGMMGAQGARDARETLAERGITDPAEIRRAEDGATLVNAALGLISEPLLGAPAMLKSVRGAGAGLLAKAGIPAATTSTARVVQEFIKGTVREAVQEGLVEQLGANVAAKDIIGYDPERARTEGVAESAMLGGLIGGPVAGSFKFAQDRDATAAHRKFAAALDTDKNVPESDKTLFLQQDQLMRGLRPAQMFPNGTEELGLPENMQRVQTPRGVFHYNPSQITAEQIKAASAAGEENLILGLGPISKPAAEARAAKTGEPLVVTTERAADGTEIKSAVGTTGTAAAQAAALNASKSPGSTVSTTTPGQMIIERQRAKQDAATAAARAALEKEVAERTERQAKADAKKTAILETMSAAREWASDPEVDLPKLKGAITSLDSALTDGSLGLSQEQRNQAAALRKQLTPRYEALKLADDAAASQRLIESKATLAAEQAATKARVRAETEAINAIKTTGRDPRDGNIIVELANVPDEEFYRIENDLEAEGLDRATWEEELERRMRESERTDDSAMPDITLADVFTGANGAKKWLGKTLRLPTAAALRADGNPLAGDMETVQESLPFGWFVGQPMDLDGIAETLRGYGFDIQTPGDLLEALRSPEDVRPSQSGGSDVNFAEGEQSPQQLLETAERGLRQVFRRNYSSDEVEEMMDLIAEAPTEADAVQGLSDPRERFYVSLYWQALQKVLSTKPAAATPAAPAETGSFASLVDSVLFNDLASERDDARGIVRGFLSMDATQAFDWLSQQPFTPATRLTFMRQWRERNNAPATPAPATPPAPSDRRYDYRIENRREGPAGEGWYLIGSDGEQMAYLGDDADSPEVRRSAAARAIYDVELDSEEYADLPTSEVLRRIDKRIAPSERQADSEPDEMTPRGWGAPQPRPAPAPAVPDATPRSTLVRVAEFFKTVAAQASAWQLGPTPTSKDIADIAKAYSTKKVRIAVSTRSENNFILHTTDEKKQRIGEITFHENRPGEINVGAIGAESNKDADGGGKQMYQVIFTWAHNNGMKVLGSSLTKINQVRRTVNMLSSALRHGTTNHLVPYGTQDIKGWVDGDTENNVGAMVVALSGKLSTLTNGRLDSLTYDVTTDTVVDNVTGRTITPAELSRIINADKLYDKGFGFATVRAILAARSQMAAHARRQGLDAEGSQRAAQSGSLRGVLYAEGDRRGEGAARPGADRGGQAGQSGNVSGVAPTPTSWRDIPGLRTDAEIDAEIEGIRALFPRLAKILDLKVGDISKLLSKARRRRIAAPPSVDAAVTTDIETERLLIALSARAAQEGSLSSLFLHEIGHKYWDILPDYAKDFLRQLHERETSTRTGPLFNQDEKRTKRTKIKILEQEFSAERLAQDEDLAVKEWFCERLAAMNRDWLAGRMPKGAPLFTRLWRQFLDFLSATFAGVRKLDPDSEVFQRAFRQWLRAGDINTADTATAYARGDRGRAQFATTQGTMDLGSTALGLDLPDTIRNLTPKYQDKTVRFESALDKALYYAGGEGQTATKTAITEHLQRETGLSAGEIATLARELRRKMAPIARSTARDGTMRVPAQMQAEARKLTGVEFAEGEDQPVLARLDAKRTDLTPTDEDKRVAAKWLAVMPAFQGGKYQMAEPAARIIREKFTPAQREQIETVVDYFGGGGMWGGYLALTHFPNAKRLVVYELEGYRAEKIRAFLTEADRMPQAFTRPEVKAILDSVVAQANADRTTSGSALAARLKDRYRSQTDPQIKSLLGALIDAQMSARGRAVDTEGNKTAEASMEKLTNLVIRDATDAAKGASALRERGVQVDVRNEDSYASQPVTGDRVLSVMDPPYYLTTGYLGEIVGIETYRKTDQLLRRNASTGNAVIYTDAAWHLDHPERFQTQDELIQITPEDHERLGNIVDSISSLGTVGLEERHEILGINLPGHTAGAASVDARAARDSADSDQAGAGRGPARSDRSSGAQERGLDAAPNAPGDVAAKGQERTRADRDGARAADRSTRREQLKANLPPGVTTAAKLSAEQQAEADSLTEAAKKRHPAAVGDVEPGAAWASVAKLTPEQLAEQIRAIDTYLSDNFVALADIEKANLRAIRQATVAEQSLRQDEARAKAKPAEPVIPKADRKAALVAQWKQGKRMRDLAGDNLVAWNEGQNQVAAAKRALDDEFPEWADEHNPPAKTKADQSGDANKKVATPARARADQIEQDDGRNIPTPPPPDAPEKGVPAADDPAPDRGRANQAFGHSATTPAWWERSWAKARAVFVGFRGAIPELQAFPDTDDRFVARHGKQFYNGLKAFLRTLSSANDYIQRTAEEQVAAITEPLMKLGGRFDADAYKQLSYRQQQARRLAAEGKPMPTGAAKELDALLLRLESHPYYLFNRLVFFMDLDWRHRNLKDSAGNPIKLPAGLNETEIANELTALGNAIAASPHAAAIEAAYDQHTALVKQIAEDLKGRDLFAAEALTNPAYFPHVTLQITQGDKTKERELRPERVRVDVEADFRAYLQDPVGSTKPIESDYVRAMYFHLVAVGAHNLKADAIRDHIRPYNVRAQVEKRAQELSKDYGRTVSWEEAYHIEYQKDGYVLHGTNTRDAFPIINVDRNKLAQRLGVILTSEDIHKQLAELGLKGIQLLPEDIKETFMQGQREIWVVPARVAEAMQGIAHRQKHEADPISVVLKTATGWWKAWKLFMPQNHIRYEYGNVVADLEKVFSASPRTFKKMPQAAKEMREFFNGGIPSADLRAALKDGVINAVTAQEMHQLQRLRAFEKFQTKTERALLQIRKRASSALYQPVTNLIGLGDLSSVELSAFREGVTRYANYLANLDAIRNGARPDYAGAYAPDIEALQDSSPGAGDRAARQAAQISKATFGDYGDLSVTGQWLRDHMIPFYSWMEINFRYHANLFRNNLDLVRGKGTAAQGAAATARQASALVGGFAARLAVPYVMIALWNALGSGVDDDELSEEDRRRVHIRLGHTADGKPIVVYANTALADVMKWVSGPKFIEATTQWFQGKTDLPTAFASWVSEIPGDFVNNSLGSTGPIFKIGVAAAFKKATFPDILDARTIPDYDLRRNILGQITDDFTADQIERIVNKDYAAPKDYGVWAKQLILQMRQRDPEGWAFYSIKDKAAAFVEARTGQSRDSSYNAPDQQVLRNFRRAIYQGDPEQASKFYLRLLELGYTSERFTSSIRAQDPLSALPKESGLRREFVASLRPDEQAQLKRAYAYYTRMSTARGAETALFPSKAWGERGQQAYQERPRLDLLNQTMQRRAEMTDAEILRRADAELRRSLAGPN